MFFFSFFFLICVFSLDNFDMSLDLLVLFFFVCVCFVCS